jgi:hypothetical protein
MGMSIFGQICHNLHLSLSKITQVCYYSAMNPEKTNGYNNYWEAPNTGGAYVALDAVK